MASALDGLTLDQGVIARDRKQGFFAQSFLAFSDKLISQNRIQNGQARLKQHRDLFAKVEKQYGVPGRSSPRFWALESDYGASMGKLPILRSLATLAYDCRRSEMFRTELMDTLRIIDRGDLDARGDDRLVGRRARARRSSSPRTTSSTRWTTTATAGAT